MLVGVANQRREHGPIDFIGEAGAQVGIGDSKDEKQARAAAASAERAAEVAERIGDGKAAAKAERMEKFDETKKAWGLEKHVKDLDGSHEVPVIFEANRPMLKNPDKIYVGRVLGIPELS